ncbi:hypothetical protein SELMODRAFT_407653 [Selaginella moellendorffii]|uniref:Late embryogenesis abundant protein LEA-2 subgroup domain-containing protein n=1 Tax=Selaginella moellendorffii TaxID=88036 RepID=D8R6A9_SELML|nr:hypothetical protein SELMODRAFT_407653 [Selaginella moellendorffii]
MTPVTPAQIAWQQAAGEGCIKSPNFFLMVKCQEGCGIRKCVSVCGHEMPRGVRFGGDAEGDEEAGKVAQAGGKFTRISLVVDEDEGIPNSQNLSRIFNKSHFDAAERELQREQQLKALGEELFGGLVAFSCVFFILCLIMLAMYIHLQPVAPDFEVTGAGFVSLAITALTPAQIAEQTSSGSGNYFAAYFTFNASYTILFTNSNKKVDMFVESIELTVFYNGFRFGATKSMPFTQPRSSSQSFKLFVSQKLLPIPLNVYYTMLSSSGKRTFFGADLVMKGTMSTIGTLKSPPFNFRVRCNLVLKNYIIIEKYCKRLN